MNKHSIGLKELINQIRNELLQEHPMSNPLFVVGQVELEISFTVERNLNGGIDLQVVQAKADKNITDVQTIKVSLSPIVSLDEVKAVLTPEQKSKALKALQRTLEDPIQD